MAVALHVKSLQLVLCNRGILNPISDLSRSRVPFFGFQPAHRLTLETSHVQRQIAAPTKHKTCTSAIIGEGGDGDREEEAKSDQSAEAEAFRLQMEKMMSVNDEAFSGRDLATLIRNKYGKSYDVQLLKKEFMGRQFTAMNVMWKYREQKSFPLTEDEYIYHLDRIADNLRCWGAVSTVRSSLEKTKERPRIGKGWGQVAAVLVGRAVLCFAPLLPKRQAVSIFIEIDDLGARANEWINR
eukprot:jgi/Mesen1/5888/ME000003S06919